MLKTLFNAWGKLNPKIRLLIQTIAIGAVTYLAQDLSDGDVDDWEGLWLSVKVGVGYGLLALITPLSPYVGIGKPDVVEVPPDPPTVVDRDS